MCFQRFEAYLGRFDRPYVPRSLKVGPFWDQKGVKRGPFWGGFGCALRPTVVLKGMRLARFVAVLDTQYVQKTFGRAKNV